MFRTAIISYGRRLSGAVLPRVLLPPTATPTTRILGTRAYALTSCKDLVNNHSETWGRSTARQVLVNEAKESNVVLSPLSLNVVLSLVAAGAKGKTLKELLSFLKSDSVDDVTKLYSRVLLDVFADGSTSGGPKISADNAVWIQKNLPLKALFRGGDFKGPEPPILTFCPGFATAPFTRVVESLYNASCFPVDFIGSKAEEIISQVNSWAEKQTNGLIKEALPPGSVDALTRLIIANTLYFKGKWSIENFDASETKEYDFHLRGDSPPVKAPFMTSGMDQLISVYDGFKVLGLPYKSGNDVRDFPMYIFLPDSKDELPALEEKLLGGKTRLLDQHLPRKSVPVNEFRVPKFKISFGFEASKTLKRLGLRLPFTPGGLTEMVDSHVGEEMYVGEIYHKSFIEVNEEGTEAASVSVVDGLGCCLPVFEEIQPVDFVADHPFMFLIRENTTVAVLFIGHVLNPLRR